VINSTESHQGLCESRSVLERLPFPAALWSPDRQSCIFNNYVSRLVGFSENDFLQESSLWVERIHPKDRDSFISAWRQIQSGENNSVSCYYRFLPGGRSEQIRMREDLFSHPCRKSEPAAVWSLYAEQENSDTEILESPSLRDFVNGFNHEIGNGLQAIKGEIDLLLLAGALPPQSARAVDRGIQRIAELTDEVHEYLALTAAEPRRENLVRTFREVIQLSSQELEDRGIRVAVEFKDQLPELPLGSDFCNAIKWVIDFSCALLPKGGDLKIEAGVKRIGAAFYIELRVINVSPSCLDIEEKEVFRPYLKVNEYQVGLTMVLAQQILRRHFGKIIFQKEQRNRGVFLISIKVPSDKAI
jgi:signal transduction histidine kinase